MAIYNSHFGFAELPFNVTPDPRFSYVNARYQEAFATLRYGIQGRKGFIVITGEVGTGKTTLLRKAMQTFDSNVHAAFIFNTHLTVIELLRIISSELGLPASAKDKLTLMDQLNDYLIKQLRKGHIVAVLVDEAQELSNEMLEELRLLSNLETDRDKLVQIVLMGQPELERKLEQSGLRQLKQRVALRCRLYPLESQEVGAYIAARLNTVGYKHKKLFSPEAVEKIAIYSRGIPRLINVICDNALLNAFGASSIKVTAAIIDEVARDLRLVEQPKEKVHVVAEEANTGYVKPAPVLPSRDQAKNDVWARRPNQSGSGHYFLDLEQRSHPVPAPRSSAGAKVGIAMSALLLAGVGVSVYSQPMQTTMSTLSGRLKEFVNVGQNGRALEEPTVATPALNDEVIDAKPRPEFPLPFSAPAGDTYPDKRVITEVPKEPVIERKSSISAAAEEHVGKRKRVSDQSNTVRGASIRPTSTEPPSNEKLEAEVHRAISNRAIQGVAVSVSDGTAYLGGRVASVRQKIVAARAAGSVTGIKNIENRIAVGPE